MTMDMDGNMAALGYSVFFHENMVKSIRIDEKRR